MYYVERTIVAIVYAIARMADYYGIRARPILARTGEGRIASARPVVWRALRHVHPEETGAVCTRQGGAFYRVESVPTG